MSTDLDPVVAAFVNGAGSDLPLYRPPEGPRVERGRVVVLCDGQASADAAGRFGLAARGLQTGRDSIPCAEALAVLRGHSVALWPEATDASRNRMARVGEALRGLATSVRTVRSGESPARMVARGGTAEEAARLVEQGARFEVVRLADIETQRVEWLWQGRIPLGKLVILDGDPGVGKTTLTADLAARVSRGEAMPGEVRGREPAGVLLISAEDGVADTLRPRVEAAGGDLHRVVAFPQENDSEALALSSPEHLEAIREVIVSRGVLLVVIDPLMAYLGDAESHKDQDVRRVLGPLSRLAEGTGAVVLGIRHLNKSAGSNALYRGGGSIGITAAARSALLVAKDPEDESRRVLAVSKCNLAAPAPAIAFRIVTEHDTARVRWEEETSHTPGQLLAGPREEDEPGALDEAKAFVIDTLRPGAIESKALEKAATSAGIAPRTLRRARRELGVKPRRPQGCKVWVCELPAPIGQDGPLGPLGQVEKTPPGSDFSSSTYQVGQGGQRRGGLAGGPAPGQVGGVGDLPPGVVETI